MSTQLFMRNLSGNPVAKPIGVLGPWDGNSTNTNGVNAARLSTASGPGQSNLQLTNTSDVKLHCLGQFLSDTLASQVIGAASWTIGFALQSSVATSYNGAAIFILVNGFTGASRAIITSLNTLGVARTSTSELTVFSASFAGSSVTASAGDYIAVEVGITYNSLPTGATSQLWVGGTIAIASDNAAATDAQSFVTCPTTLVFGPDLGGSSHYSEPDAYAFQQGLYIPIAPIGAI